MSTVTEQRKTVKNLQVGWSKLKPLPVTKWQQTFPQDAPAKGPIWVSRSSLKSPTGFDPLNIVTEAFKALSPSNQNPSFGPALADGPVKVHWLGQRAGAAANATEPQISEKQKFDNLNEELKCDATVLYVHGGAL